MSWALAWSFVTVSGFGPLALTSAAGGSLPVTNSKELGHTMTWNNTVQYHLGSSGFDRLFWPEREFNSSFMRAAPTAGRSRPTPLPASSLAAFPCRMTPRAILAGWGSLLARADKSRLSTSTPITTLLSLPLACLS